MEDDFLDPDDRSLTDRWAAAAMEAASNHGLVIIVSVIVSSSDEGLGRWHAASSYSAERANTLPEAVLEAVEAAIKEGALD